MPPVPITSDKQLEKMIGVLTEVGGTWQGVGGEEHYLIVNQKQFDALEKAKLVPKKPTGGSARGKKHAKK